MTLADFYGKRKNKVKEVSVTDDPPRFLNPNRGQQEVAPATRARYRSEAAALAAQHVDDLEQEIKDLKTQYQREVDNLKNELHTVKGRLVTFESANSMLTTEVELLRAQSADDKAKLAAHRAKLQVAAKIIIDMAQEAPPPAEREAASLDAVEEALRERGTLGDDR